MDKFFQYFKEKLKFFLLWQENNWWAVFKGIAAEFSTASEHIKWTRNVFLVEDTADFIAGVETEKTEMRPDTFRIYTYKLERLARSRGLKRLPYESDTNWITRVIDCYTWYTHKVGRTATIDNFISLAPKQLNPETGEPYKVDITEFRDPDKTDYQKTIQWAEFYVEYKKPEISEQELRFAKEVVNEFKRASAKAVYSAQSKDAVLHYNSRVESYHMGRAFAFASHPPNPVATATLIGRTDASSFSSSFDDGLDFDGDWFFDEYSNETLSEITAKMVSKAELGCYDVSDNINYRLDNKLTLDNNWMLDRKLKNKSLTNASGEFIIRDTKGERYT